MERCDFSSVINIIINYLNVGKGTSQMDLMYDVFGTFINDTRDYDFDHGKVSRWINGIDAVSPKIIQYYSDDDNVVYLHDDLAYNVFPKMTDVSMACRDIYELVISDISISDEKKSELTADHDFNDEDKNAEFIGNIILFAIQRKFVSRETKLAVVSGTSSPVLSDMIFGCEAPDPCRHFSGRVSEINELHEILQKNYKVFVSGIAGIGKSELVKAYIKKNRKLYTNILYFSYDTDLKNLISDIDFINDFPTDTDDVRFKNHNRYLRSLKEDTLIVIDNFNTTADDDDLLDVVMKYKCRIIFTTRSSFDCGYTYRLGEISDIDGLLELFGKLFSETEKNIDTVTKIIETVNRHTLSVELAARLLEKGMLEPDDVLEKLTECSVDPDTSDRINVKKDGKSVKATFYEHIRTLFSLFKLSDDYKYILRCMSFVRVGGISSRLFAYFLSLPDLNDINDLVELGLIKEDNYAISLPTIVHEIVVADLVPSISNCFKMLDNIHQICLTHGNEISNYQTLFLYIEDIITDIKNDNSDYYIRFIEDSFSSMEKYQYESGMRLIRSVMKSYSKALKPNDLALYYDFEAAISAMFDHDMKQAISFSQTAIDTCVPEDDLHLAANLNMNLGYNYHLARQLEPAKTYMEKAIEFISKYGKLNNDFLIIYHNYANLMSDLGEPIKAVRTMKKCADMIKKNIGENMDYADLRLDIGKIYLNIGNVQKAKENLSAAFMVYISLFGNGSELVTNKVTELAEFALTHGVPFDESYIALT